MPRTWVLLLATAVLLLHTHVRFFYSSYDMLNNPSAGPHWFPNNAEWISLAICNRGDVWLAALCASAVGSAAWWARHKRWSHFLCTIAAVYGATVVLALPEEPMGGFSKAGHQPSFSFPPFKECPAPPLYDLPTMANQPNHPHSVDARDGLWVERRMRVLSLAHIVSPNILRRWARARGELATVRGAGAEFNPVFFADDPAGQREEIACARHHFPRLRVVTDDDVAARFPSFFGTEMGLFRIVRARWAWVLVQVQVLIANNGVNSTWVIEPDVGWVGSLPRLLAKAPKADFVAPALVYYPLPNFKLFWNTGIELLGHSQLQVMYLSSRLLKALVSDVDNGRLCYCEYHITTVCMSEGMVCKTLPRSLLSKEFNKWEPISPEQWEYYKQTTAGPKFFHTLKF